jgi:hypothetical protein
MEWTSVDLNIFWIGVALTLIVWTACRLLLLM